MARKRNKLKSSKKTSNIKQEAKQETVETEKNPVDAVLQSMAEYFRMSTAIDPWRLMGNNETVEKPTRFRPDLLVYLYRSVPIITMMTERRLSQMSQLFYPLPLFSQGNEIGWEVRHKLHRDPDFDSNSKKIKNRALEIREILLKPYTISDDCPNFMAFGRAAALDHIIHDRVVWENIPNRLNGKMMAFCNVSGPTIRPFAPYLQQYMLNYRLKHDYQGVAQIVDEHREKHKDNDKLKDKINNLDVTTQYVQIVHADIVAEFKKDRLNVVYESHDADIKYTGYGYSKVEKCAVATTQYLNAMNYNDKLFTDAILSDYMFKLKGELHKQSQEDFEAELKKKATGIKGAHGAIFAHVDDQSDIAVEFLRQQNKDMEFMNYLNYMVAVHTAIFDMDASEVNMTSFSATGAGGLGHAREQEIESKKSGFYNMAIFFKTQVFDPIVQLIDPDFEWCISGIFEAETEQERIEIINSKKWMTVNEMRKQDGLSDIKLDSKIGKTDVADVPLDPQVSFLLQAAGQQEMMEQQQEQQEENGEGEDYQYEGFNEDKTDNKNRGGNMNKSVVKPDQYETLIEEVAWLKHRTSKQEQELEEIKKDSQKRTMILKL